MLQWILKILKIILLVVLLHVQINLLLKVTEKLHKPIIRKFEKRKVYSSFKDNIWRTDLADMQLTSKYNKAFINKGSLLCVIKIFSKYAWVAPLKDKKCITTTDAFQKILIDSGHKLKKYG